MVALVLALRLLVPVEEASRHARDLGLGPYHLSIKVTEIDSGFPTEGLKLTLKFKKGKIPLWSRRKYNLEVVTDSRGRASFHRLPEAKVTLVVHLQEEKREHDVEIGSLFRNSLELSAGDKRLVVQWSDVARPEAP